MWYTKGTRPTRHLCGTHSLCGNGLTLMLGTRIQTSHEYSKIQKELLNLWSHDLCGHDSMRLKMFNGLGTR